MQQDLASSLEELNIEDISYITNVMVIRLEHILNGKSFSKLNEISQGLFEVYNSYFKERVAVLENYLKTLPPKSQDTEYQIYLSTKRLIETPSEKLSVAQREQIVEIYNSSVTSMENNMSRLSIVPQKIRSDGETFELSAAKSVDTMQALQKRLLFFLQRPKRVEAEEKIKLYKTQIKINNDALSTKLTLAINKQILLQRYNKIVDILSNIKKITGKKIELVVDNLGYEPVNSNKTKIPYSYSEEEMQKLYKLYKNRAAVDEMYFSEFYNENFMPISRENFWDFNQVAFANYKKNEFVKSLKLMQLSPLQNILAAYGRVAKLTYAGNATADERTRTFLTAELSQSEEDAKELDRQGYGFVCTGVAQYLKAIIDELGDKNIKCKLVAINAYGKEDLKKRYEDTHMAVLIYVNDEKYGVKGHYLCDPTLDLSEGVTFSSCLIPLADIDRYKKNIRVIEENDNVPLEDFLLKSKRNDKLEKRWNNGAFLSRYLDSEPIKVEQFKQALEDIFLRARKLPKTAEGFEDARSSDKSCEQLAIDALNRTIHNLFSYEPETATNDFYRKLRDFYLMNLDYGYEDWAECWLAHNETIMFTEEDFHK